MVNQKSAQITYLKRQGSTSFFSIRAWRTWRTWKTSNSWLNTFYLWFQTLYLWFKTILLSNGWLITLYFMAVRIATYGHCTSWMLYKYTIEQFYSFREKMHCIKLYCIYFKSMCLVTIPLVDYATLFCLEVTVTEETKELFIISILFKIIFHNSFNTWTIGLGWCSALLANSNNCIFTIFIQSEISNVIPNALLATIQSQSCFNNANILQIMFASVTPIGPLEKMQSYSTCSTSSFSRSHLCWKSSWATSVPFVSCKEREQKRVKMYHF